METKARQSIIAALVLAACAAAAPAEIVRIGLTAEVTYMEDWHGLLEGRINVGDLITGYYTYDSETPDIGPETPVYGRYEYSSPPYGIKLTAGGFVFETDPERTKFSILIRNDKVGQDGYSLDSWYNLPLDNGVKLASIDWQLDDFSGTAISIDALPTTPPVLEDWPDTWVGLSVKGGDGIRGGAQFSIRSTVTSVYLIPEPATLSLLLLGGLLTFRRRS